MKIKPLNERRIIRIKNVNGCTNFGGFALNGDRLYTIKTKSGNELSTISVYPNYNKTKRTNYVFHNSFGHGNSMTYFNNELYVAPCGGYCGTVDVRNWNYKKLESDTFMSGISHYTGTMFITIAGAPAAGSKQFYLAIMNRVGDRMVCLKKWIINNPYVSKGYTISQGIGYRKSKKKIYFVLSHENLKSNVVLRYGLEKSDPDYLFKSKVVTGSDRLELEDVDFDANDNIFMGSNEPNSMDGLYRVR